MVETEGMTKKRTKEDFSARYPFTECGEKILLKL
jgi:hypothetical protein